MKDDPKVDRTGPTKARSVTVLLALEFRSEAGVEGSEEFSLQIRIPDDAPAGSSFSVPVVCSYAGVDFEIHLRDVPTDVREGEPVAITATIPLDEPALVQDWDEEFAEVLHALMLEDQDEQREVEPEEVYGDYRDDAIAYGNELERFRRETDARIETEAVRFLEHKEREAVDADNPYHQGVAARLRQTWARPAKVRSTKVARSRPIRRDGHRRRRRVAGRSRARAPSRESSDSEPPLAPARLVRGAR